MKKISTTAPRTTWRKPLSVSVAALCGLALAGVAAAALHEYERPRLDVGALERAGSERGPGDDWTVDLHSHLFMKPGMGILFNGSFFGPLRARGWKSRFGQQINEETLRQSRIGLMVVALYANPIFTWTPRAAIREEIRQAELFVSRHPDEWVIARSAEEARAAIDRGKRVLVLSLERASWILETEADLKEFVDEKGIRIVTLMHLIDDRFGGAGFLKGYRQLSSPWRWIQSLFKPVRDRDGVKINPHGLKPRGFEMARRLMDRGVWLDLSHSSDYSQRDLVPLIEAAGHPLLYTHGPLRRFSRNERGISDDQLAEVARAGGIVGICPSEDGLNPTEVPPELCNVSCPYSCNWGLPAFVTHFAAAAKAIGPQNVFVGTDFNGAIPHLHPSCGTGTGLDRRGLWNIGQMGEFWAATRRLGAPLPDRLSRQIDSFLEHWARVKARRSIAGVEQN